MDESSAVVETFSLPTVTLDRERFLRTLVGETAATLEDLVGLEEASGLISVVGQTMGRWIDREYRQALGEAPQDPAGVAEVLVDLERRVGGDFYVIESDEDRIVLGNRACPFGDEVLGHPALCMMTSNVFGVIAADNLGYGKVELQETIARGHDGCRVVIHLGPGPAADRAAGREYFRSRG